MAAYRCVRRAIALSLMFTATMGHAATEWVGRFPAGAAGLPEPWLVQQLPEPLAPTMPVEEALGRTMDAEDGLLPVVDATGRLLGVVSETMLLDAESPDAEVATGLRGQPGTIGPDAHTFEVTKRLVQHDLAAHRGGQLPGARTAVGPVRRAAVRSARCAARTPPRAPGCAVGAAWSPHAARS
mgnify:CR=1 FL=1